MTENARWRRCGIFALAFAVSWAGGCRKDNAQKSEGVPSVIVAPAGEGEIALRPWKPDPPLRVSGVVHSPSSIRFSVSIDGAGSGGAEPLVFCVPPERELRLSVVSDSRAAGEAPATAGETLSIERKGVMRRWSLAAVEVPRQITTEPYTLQIQIDWDEPYELAAAPAGDQEAFLATVWGRTMGRLVANPEGLSFFRMAESPLREGLNPEPQRLPDAEAWARVRVTERGLYRLPVARLADAGFAADQLDAAGLRLYRKGRPYPVLRRGDDVYFWNDANESPYTAEHVYWVGWAPGEAESAIAALDETDSESVHELDHTIRTATLDRDNQLVLTKGAFLMILDTNWLDAKFEAGKPIELPVQLVHAVDGQSTGTAELHVFLDGAKEDLNSLPVVGATVELSAAGRSLGRQSVRAVSDQALRYAVPGELLRSGLLAFSATLHQREGSAPLTQLWADRLSVRYASENQFADGRLTLSADAATTAAVHFSELGAAPSDVIALVVDEKQRDGSGEHVRMASLARREGRAGIAWPNRAGVVVECYEAAAIPEAGEIERAEIGDLLDENQGADYVIITHREFVEGVHPLAEFHEGRGLRVRVVDVQSIYDAFNGGEFSPEAIRDFLAYTLNHWKNGAPETVLLVGDCTSDYRGVMRNGIVNWVPSYERESGGHRYASDEWMALVAGDDLLTDFVIGRISVNNTADLEAIVSKRIAYAEKARFGEWRSKMLMVADDDAVFAASLDELKARLVPGAMTTPKVYLADSAVEDNWYATDRHREARFAAEGWWWKVSSDATSRIASHMREGASIVTFFGHGSPNVWAEERMWFGGDSENSDNLLLADSGHASFVINLTCNSGAIDYPDRRWNVNIIEDMLRTRDGGAIGTFVPSGPGYPQQHHVFAGELYRLMFNEGVRNLGELAALTKARYAIAGNPEEYIYMYILLGDPALDVKLTEDMRAFKLPRRVYRPGESIQSRLVSAAPAEGKYIATIESPEGKRLWASSELEFSNGRIPIDIVLPAELPLGPKTLRVAAWNESQATEFVAWADFTVRYPEDEIVSIDLGLADPNAPALHVNVRADEAIRSAGSSIEIVKHEGAATEIVESRPYAIEAGETVQLAFEVEPASGDRAAVYEARIAPAGPALSLERAAFPSVKIAVPAAESALRIVYEMSSWRWSEPPARGDVEIAAAGRLPSTTIAELRAANGDLLATSTLTLQGAAQMSRANLFSSNLDYESLRSAEVRIVSESQTMDAVAIGELPRSAARLRIAPGSLRVTPEDPSEGETIWVHARVENIGDRVSSQARARLYDREPAPGIEPVYTHTRQKVVVVPPLGPGRGADVVLRWDPVKNAGDSKFWVDVEPAASDLAAEPGALTASGLVRVRTKPKLVHANFAARANEEDRRRGRLHVIVDIKNEGETDARQVNVAFFNSSAPDPEKEIYQELLDVVPAGETRRVHYQWEVRGANVALENERIPVSLQYYRKGSQQRTSVGAEQAE